MTYFPAAKSCACIGVIDQKVYGVMPCGDVKRFINERQYEAAYDDELDEFVDEMARLEEEREYPEDYEVVSCR